MLFKPTQLTKIPTTPGIYKMLDKHNTIIYVGKAKQLKNRIKSYFSNSHKDLKTTVMVKKINAIEIIQTTTEKEALILENQLIKTIKPKYNILLKDDKTFPYIKITTNEPFPRIITTRKKSNDGARYYGPYPSIGSTRKLRKTLYDLFPIRDCKQPITLTEQQPKCLLLDIDKCIGPCIYKNIKPEYDELIHQLHLLLTGKNKSLLIALKKQMNTYSSELAYEKAAIIRDKITQISHLVESQKVDIDSNTNLQLWAFCKNDHFYYMLVQEIIDGKLIAQHGFYKNRSTIEEHTFIEQTFIAFQSQYMLIPDAIVTTQSVATIIEPIISLFPQHKLIIPERGLKKELLTQTLFNSKQALNKLIIDSIKPHHSHVDLTTIKTCLQLKHSPERIIGFDISHIQGKYMVASAVYFKNGLPEKSLYRKFNIKTIEGHSNDPAAIAEAVYRRLSLALKENEPLPQLLCIDGGRGQLNFAFKAVRSLNLENKIELISIAKREEEIYLVYKQKPLQLPRNHSVLTLLQQIRDESHRFANSFRHQKHSKAMTHSILLDIPGLGKKRLNDLYQRFKSIEHIKTASIEELTSLPSIGPRLATIIKNKLQSS